MQIQKIKKVLWNSFWLSFLFHLLLLCYLFFLMREPASPPQKIREIPRPYVPAYTYTGSIKPGHQQPRASGKVVKARHQASQREAISPPSFPSHTQGDIPVGQVSRRMPAPYPPAPSSASLLADAFNVMQEEQIQSMSDQGEPDPIYLIGDDSQPADPLIRLIGQSLSRHFEYPQTAGRLGIKGRVLVKLTLHPEGYFSDVQIIQSSHSQDLDGAALYAVNAAPQVYGANRFISKPKRIVIGFIFN